MAVQPGVDFSDDLFGIARLDLNGFHQDASDTIRKSCCDERLNVLRAPYPGFDSDTGLKQRRHDFSRSLLGNVHRCQVRLTPGSNLLKSPPKIRLDPCPGGNTYRHAASLANEYHHLVHHIALESFTPASVAWVKMNRACAFRNTRNGIPGQLLHRYRQRRMIGLSQRSV